jgi:hypothetical protein
MTQAMTHKFPVGAAVYFEAGIGAGGARGLYKIIRHLPVERDRKVLYRIKSQTEQFERIADEENLVKQN